MVELIAGLCLLWFGTGFLAWLAAGYYFIRTICETRSGFDLFDYLFGFGSLVLFDSSKLTENGLVMRRRLMLSVLGLFLSMIFFIMTGALAKSLNGGQPVEINFP